MAEFHDLFEVLIEKRNLTQRLLERYSRKYPLLRNKLSIKSEETFSTVQAF